MSIFISKCYVFDKCSFMTIYYVCKEKKCSNEKLKFEFEKEVIAVSNGDQTKTIKVVRFRKLVNWCTVSKSYNSAVSIRSL